MPHSTQCAFTTLLLTLLITWYRNALCMTSQTNLTQCIIMCIILSSVSVSFESEPKLKDIVRELTSESKPPWAFPLPIHNLKCNILCECRYQRTDNCHKICIYFLGIQQRQLALMFMVVVCLTHISRLVPARNTCSHLMGLLVQWTKSLLTSHSQRVWLSIAWERV